MNDCEFKMSTDWKRQAYYVKNLNLVEPETHELGRDEKGVKRTFQYVPLLKSLRALLMHSDVRDQVAHPLRRIAGHLRDFRDGSLFRSNELFSRDSNALQLFLYYDEFEVVNPLGSHTRKHKIGAFYYVLGNLHPEKRSALYVIQLALLCRYQDLKYFGVSKILHALLHDARLLETDGIVVDQERFYGTIAALIGDNLGSHFLGGFTTCFSGGPNSRICRFCMATRDRIQKSFNPLDYEERTVENYSNQAALVADNPELSKIYGIQSDSAFNVLKYFHVARGLPPDIMHDLLEGVVPYEISLIFKAWIGKGLISLQFINRQIRTFKYGILDARNKPVEVADFKKSLKQNAGRMWVLIRLLPLMLMDKIPPADEHFEFLVLLKRIVEIVFSPVISSTHVAYLDSLVQDHHRLFVELFPRENSNQSNIS